MKSVGWYAQQQPDDSRTDGHTHAFGMHITHLTGLLLTVGLLLRPAGATTAMQSLEVNNYVNAHVQRLIR